ncbi:hypothetical protein [Roseicella aerolata]|uniref:Uncharacterized protein n=1 Tax=Roseicella aerolata TaxID=2883479 RepID=A0A9X1ICF0_9PROT|nr:hypothetical protein [Roseicella aerolata]MCB4822154.1 hypothetical protein [Roseicella aerolata]
MARRDPDESCATKRREAPRPVGRGRHRSLRRAPALLAALLLVPDARADMAGEALIAFCRPHAAPAGAGAGSCVCSVEQIEHALTEGEFVQYMLWRRAAGTLTRSELRLATGLAAACGEEAARARRAAAVLPVPAANGPHAP